MNLWRLLRRMSRSGSLGLLRDLLMRVGITIQPVNLMILNSFLGLQLEEVRTVIDVGAYDGDSARLFSKIFPRARIYCFEPGPPFYRLKELESKNPRLKVFNFALGERNGNVLMHYKIDHPGSSSILKSTELDLRLYSFVAHETAMSVPMTTLDKALENEELQQDILIKLDVEGYEDRVIAGGRKTFQHAAAAIIEVCLVNLYQGQATFQGICSQMHELGFAYSGNIDQVYDDDNGGVTFINAAFVRPFKVRPRCK